MDPESIDPLGLESSDDPAARIVFLARAKQPTVSSPTETVRVRAWLRTASTPEESMDKLLEGDPLDLLPRAARVLQSRARILDPMRIHACAAARVAFRGFDWKGKPDLDRWLVRCIDEAIRDAMSEDEEEERYGRPLDERYAPRYEVMTELLGCPIELARIVMLTFNRLPLPERFVAHSVLLLGKDLGDIELPRSIRQKENRDPRALFAVAMSKVESATPGKIPAPAPDEYDLSSANDA